MSQPESEKPSVRKKPPVRRQLPLRRFEEVAESLAEEERVKKPAQDPLDDDRDLPRYLRRERPSSNLWRTSLIATGLVFFTALALALLLRPEPNPTIPAGIKINRGLAVLASPRGFTATLYTPGTSSNIRRLLSRKDGDPRDGEADGFIWFRDLPSRTVPAGNYLLDLSAPGYVTRRLPVTVQAQGTTEGFNTRTALKKDQ